MKALFTMGFIAVTMAGDMYFIQPNQPQASLPLYNSQTDQHKIETSHNNHIENFMIYGMHKNEKSGDGEELKRYVQVDVMPPHNPPLPRYSPPIYLPPVRPMYPLPSPPMVPLPSVPESKNRQFRGERPKLDEIGEMAPPVTRPPPPPRPGPSYEPEMAPFPSRPEMAPYTPRRPRPKPDVEKE